MIQDSQPLASRGRKTVVLAVFVFLLAGLISLIGKQSTNESIPVARDTLVPIGQSFDSFNEATRDTLSAVNTLPQRPSKRSSSGSVYVLIILAAGTLVALWLKRTRRPTESQGMLQTVARLSLPHNQELRVIRVRNTELVVGVSPSAVTVLHRFGAEAHRTPLDKPTEFLSDATHHDDGSNVSNDVSDWTSHTVGDSTSSGASNDVANGVDSIKADIDFTTPSRNEQRRHSTFQELLYTSIGRRPGKASSRKVTIDV